MKYQLFKSRAKTIECTINSVFSTISNKALISFLFDVFDDFSPLSLQVLFFVIFFHIPQSLLTKQSFYFYGGENLTVSKLPQHKAANESL